MADSCIRCSRPSYCWQPGLGPGCVRATAMLLRNASARSAVNPSSYILWNGSRAKELKMSLSICATVQKWCVRPLPTGITV